MYPYNIGNYLNNMHYDEDQDYDYDTDLDFEFDSYDSEIDALEYGEMPRDSRDRYRPPRDREDPSVRYIPPQVINRYRGKVMSTVIPGYGRRNVYVRGMGPYGMVNLVLLRTRPNDCISVHYSDLKGVYPPRFNC